MHMQLYRGTQVQFKVPWYNWGEPERAPPSELYGWRRCRYVCNRTFNRQIFAVCPLQACTVRKWLSLASRSNFPFGARLPVSIISSETKAAVLTFPSSLIYAAKSGRQATTVVARIFRCSVRQLSKEGLKHSNRAKIALARQLGSVCAAAFDCSRSCILATTAPARPMLSLHPWCKSGI